MTIEASIGSYYEIPDHAFRNSMITEITIPEGIETIGKGAFKNCKELTKVTLPTTLESICTGAFEGCSSLKSIEIPEGVETIQKNAFYGCTSLWKVTIPSSIKIIGPKAFDDTALYVVNIPLVGANIADDAFPKDNALYYTDDTHIGMIELAKIKKTKVLIIAEGVTDIDDKAFKDLDSLNTIILPSTLQYIGEEVFAKRYSHYTVICKLKDPNEIRRCCDKSLYMIDDFVDEDTGEIVPISRTYIRELIVPRGSAELYEDHEHFSCHSIVEADI